MKTAKMTILLAAALIAPMAASAQSVSGHANQTTSAIGFPDPNGELRTISFNAVTHMDGAVTGKIQVKNRVTGWTAHAQILCMEIVDGRAFFLGVVTHTNSPEILLGEIFAMGVEDNGEGLASLPDRVTPTASIGDVSYIEELCDDLALGTGSEIIAFLSNFFFDIERGNVQVRP